MTYQERKEAARQAAQEWQAGFADGTHSWEELVEAGVYFEKLARRYGLTKEFRENGII